MIVKIGNQWSLYDLLNKDLQLMLKNLNELVLLISLTNDPQEFATSYPEKL